jgi:LemA protein
MRSFMLVVLATLIVGLSGCGFNTLQRDDEHIKASWAEVLNQYQRRADLVPNLVRTVKAESRFEQHTLRLVVEARARATSLQATPELLDNPAALQQFLQAQSQLTGALSRLLAVSENYPNLKANQAFRDLQAQLEGTENRIAVARQRYIVAVQTYNVTVRSFPSNLTAMALGYHPKPTFQVRDEATLSAPPSVNFDDERSPSAASTGVTP